MTTSIRIQEPLNLGAVKVWPLIAPAPEVPTGTSYKTGLLQFEEMPDPDPNMLQVTNPTAQNIAVLWGTIIAGLKQTRMSANSVIVPRGMTIGLHTYCVEENRFSKPVTPAVAGRAPLSVMGSGSTFDFETLSWARDTKTNQRKVWKSVAAQEARSGRRDTGSLEQIMREDSVNIEAVRDFMLNIETVKEIRPQFNGYAIAVGDEPIIMEVLGNLNEAPNQLLETLRGLAFDLDAQDVCRVTDSQIERFVAGLTDQTITKNSRGDWDWTIEGGDESLEVRQLLDSQGSLVQVAMMNKRHRVLVGAQL